jgi:hypothetical protein
MIDLLVTPGALDATSDVNNALVVPEPPVDNVEVFEQAAAIRPTASIDVAITRLPR